MYKTKNNLTKEVKMSVQKKQKATKLNVAQSQKLFKACEVNFYRKSYNKLWVDIKEDTLPIVEDLGGFTVGKYKGCEFSLEIFKKPTSRFDVKAFKEKYPEIYDQFLVGGESIELKTKYKK
jgi:hypothetical protein